MSEILFKNESGVRTQMTDKEVKDLEDSRELARLKYKVKADVKSARESSLNTMKERMGMTDEEVDIIMNGC